MARASATPAGVARRRLRQFALSLPEAVEEFPWGESVAKVRGKVFVFLGRPEGGVAISVKLPQSGLLALQLRCASPTAYGLGRAGWVTASFGPRARVPLGLLCQWIEESYRAVAPQRLAGLLAGSAPARKPRTT